MTETMMSKQHSFNLTVDCSRRESSPYTKRQRLLNSLYYIEQNLVRVEEHYDLVILHMFNVTLTLSFDNDCVEIYPVSVYSDENVVTYDFNALGAVIRYLMEKFVSLNYKKYRVEESDVWLADFSFQWKNQQILLSMFNVPSDKTISLTSQNLEQDILKFVDECVNVEIVRMIAQG